jgi:hypothetical protein
MLGWRVIIYHLCTLSFLNISGTESMTACRSLCNVIAGSGRWRKLQEKQSVGTPRRQITRMSIGKSLSKTRGWSIVTLLTIVTGMRCFGIGMSRRLMTPPLLILLNKHGITTIFFLFVVNFPNNSSGI